MTENCMGKKYPACFGHLEIVFPKGKHGFRCTPQTCLPCSHKTQCLQSAMQGAGGLKIREEMIDRAYKSGRMGFFERWSKMKQINRQHKKK